MDIFDKLYGPPSKDQFAKLMMDAIRKAGEAGAITYEQEEFRLRGEGENGSIIFLSNAHHEYCSAPAEQRETVLKRCVRNWFAHLREMPEEFDDVKPDLFPVVRACSYFDLTRLRMEVEGHEAAPWPHEVLGEHLAVGLHRWSSPGHRAPRGRTFDLHFRRLPRFGPWAVRSGRDDGLGGRLAERSGETLKLHLERLRFKRMLDWIVYEVVACAVALFVPNGAVLA